MRPLTRPAGRSWTTTFPMRKRASLTVSDGSSQRRRWRIANFAGEFFRAMRAEDMDVELAGKQLPQVFGRKEMVIFRVLADETGGVRTKRNNPKLFLSSEIERQAGKFGRQATAFERLRHFCVEQHHAIARKVVRQ